MGTSHPGPGVEHFAVLSDLGRDSRDGAVSGDVMGSYVHGLFDSGDIANRLAAALLTRKGLDPDIGAAMDHHAFKESQYDLLADALRDSLDMDAIYCMLGMCRSKGGIDSMKI